MKIKTNKRSIFTAFLAAIVLGQVQVASAFGLTDNEALQCVNFAMQVGNDVTTCVEAALDECVPPGWFPADSMPDQITSYPLNTSTRFNETEYDPGDYSHYEHDWYSDAGVPLGPALARIGHTWNAYEGSNLVKSVSCDQTGTWAFP